MDWSLETHATGATKCTLIRIVQDDMQRGLSRLGNVLKAMVDVYVRRDECWSFTIVLYARSISQILFIIVNMSIFAVNLAVDYLC